MSYRFGFFLRSFTIYSVASAAAACHAEVEVCADSRYGNGTCEVELACGVPDIDCFTTFEDAEAARAWYSSTPVAASRGAALPATDPRFAKMQGLIDKGWRGYQQVNDVGELDRHRVPLVLVDNARLNAFVLSHESKAGLAVMVHTGLLDKGLDDDEILGVVMHELEHAVGLHLLGDVRERLRAYYLAPVGSEPLGFEQPDNAAVRALAEEWLDAAQGVGYASDIELSGWPRGGILGDVFDRVVEQRRQQAPTACAASTQRVETLRQAIARRVSVLDDSVDLAGLDAPTTIVQTLNQLQAECFAGFTGGDAIAVVARTMGIDEARLRADTPAELRAQIEGRTFLVGLFNWIRYHRNELRQVEARFASAHGMPWSRLRYYSTEEAADDSSTRTLAALGIEPTASTSGILRVSTALAAACNPLLQGNQAIPYGENLVDDHHGTCWRAGHAKALALGIAKAAPAVRTLAPTRARRPSLFPVESPPWME